MGHVERGQAPAGLSQVPPVGARDLEMLLGQLTQEPVRLENAQEHGGLPDEPGFYAWWAVSGSIPGVPRCPHPSVPGLDLFYVGIAPSRTSSNATIHSRVIGNHIRGNTAASTFRLTLAALLLESEGYERVRTIKKVVLTAEDNRRLTEWQEQQLRLTWAQYPEPWTVEHDVIAALKPPLNLAGNASHPFHRTLTGARKTFRAVD